MATKYKTTGCARFFLILIILAPLAYIGASYYNGQDGIQNIKNLFGGSADQGTSTGDSASDIYTLQDKVRKLEKDVKYFERENARLEQALRDCNNTQN